jgi:alkanesulfonate monooxygenase SsuD/methylene tetrahydromethanopterin reductase-like flavin-dependent oxidoreductase (luciferase family)
MSDNRLILGVGSGSTRDDFELLGYDYDHRFRTFKDDLEIMNRVWNGERPAAHF